VYATQTPATWGLDRIDQRALPLDKAYTYNTTAANVNAYIIDSGVRMSHTQLAPRVVSGYTAINDGRGTDDCNGHGTHVAGTIGSTTYGVAKGVNLYAVRVMDCTGSGRISGVISGVDWVTSNHIAPAVANMSLGGGASTALDDAVRNSIASGVTYVVAAGNSNADACAESPARIKQALTVGATTASDARASYSNIGSCVDVFAPGSSITSTWNSSDTATNTISGTSMASPHVAGIVALYLADHPAALPAEVFAAVTGAATPGVVTNAGSGSPNLLASSLLGPSTVSTCPAGYQPFKGNLTTVGETQYQPDGNFYYTANAGVHSGILNGAAGTDVDLYLYQWDPVAGWSVVSSSTSYTPQERIDFNTAGGFFIWGVVAYSGTGAYDFCLQHP
jgi:subtilisin family serine protease